MKNIYRAFALLCLCLISACKDKDATTETTDNLFRFKEYISFHTQGRSSIAEPIRIDLAQALEQFEMTQEIPSEYGKLFRPRYRIFG